MLEYKIKYTYEGQEIAREFKNKKQAIKYYIELLEAPAEDITSLAILKNNKDITTSINKFLFN